MGNALKRIMCPIYPEEMDQDSDDEYLSNSPLKMKVIKKIEEPIIFKMER